MTVLEKCRLLDELREPPVITLIISAHMADFQ